MEDTMDNKYGLGSTKVMHEHQDAQEHTDKPALICRFCGHDHLTISQTMHDHRCDKCGEWQIDIPLDYATGHTADY
jgi:hypothetical protein